MVDFSDDAKKLEDKGEEMAKDQIDKRFDNQNQQDSNNNQQQDNQQPNQPQQ